MSKDNPRSWIGLGFSFWCRLFRSMSSKGPASDNGLGISRGRGGNGISFPQLDLWGVRLGARLGDEAPSEVGVKGSEEREVFRLDGIFSFLT